MPEPNSSEFDGKKVDDLYIEWMLTSRDQAIRHRGLRLLDENKRMAVGGMLRRLSDDHSFNLVSDAGGQAAPSAS